MLRARLLRSTPIRLALIFLIFFAVTFIASSIAAVQLTRLHLLKKLDRDVASTYAILAATNTDNDIEDLAQAVDNQVAATRSSRDHVYLLTDSKGTPLAGNIQPRAVSDGLSVATSASLGIDGDDRYRVIAGNIGNSRLIVGKTYAEIADIGETVTVTFIWAALVALVGAIGGGVLLAMRLQHRVGAIAGTMARVANGELTARINRRGNGDDIDVLSDQINGALDQLASLFNSMKQVSADIAHDLKTPLNRLKLTVQAALSKQEHGLPVEQELMQADAETDRINATFDALLRIAQVEAGARRARFTPVELGEIAQRIGEVYVDVGSDAGMTLLLEGDRANSTIIGDRDLLLQLIANLIENAITHSPVGTRIVLSLQRRAGIVNLQVVDNGPGIPLDERDNVMRRLYRLEKSRTTPGSGLGLSLVKAIAELHEARVSLSDNKPGLCVNVAFPILST